MATGRVITGFSKPYVAKYVLEGTDVSYTNCMQLARGVDVSISASGSVDNIFYADNKAAECSSVAFCSGTFSLTTDGLLPTARNLIMGVTTTSGADWTDYDDDQKLPYCGLGFVMQEVSEGVTSYIPVVLTKVMFNPTNEVASTQEGSGVKYQSESLSGVILRSDEGKHAWKKIGKTYTTEAAAVAAITAFLVAIEPDEG